MANFLSTAPFEREGRGYANSRTSRRKSPGEPLHVGERSLALQSPVPEISEITDAHTHTHTHTWTDTQNTAINILDI